MSKKGQVTLFIIIAIVIVGLAVLLYQVIPRTSTTASGGADNPQGILETCLKEHIEETVKTISLHGGSFDPEHYFAYNWVDIEYLCYITIIMFVFPVYV